MTLKILKIAIFLTPIFGLTQSLDKDVKDCFQANVSNTGLNVNLIDIIYNFETNLIKDGFLKSRNKKAYRNLFNNICRNSIDSNKVVNVLNIASEEILGYPSIYKVTFSCTWFMIKQHGRDKGKWSDYYNILKKIDRNGLFDWNMNYNLLNKIPRDNFGNIVYRATIITIIYHYFHSFTRLKCQG